MNTSRSNISTNSSSANTFVVEYGEAAYRREDTRLPQFDYTPSPRDNHPDDWLVSPMAMSSVSRLDSTSVSAATPSLPPTPVEYERAPLRTTYSSNSGMAVRNIQYNGGAPVVGNSKPAGGVKGYYALLSSGSGSAPRQLPSQTSAAPIGAGYAPVQGGYAHSSSSSGGGNYTPRSEPEYESGGYATQVAQLYSGGGMRGSVAAQPASAAQTMRPRSNTPGAGGRGGGGYSAIRGGRGGGGGQVRSQSGGVSTQRNTLAQTAPASILERIRSRKGGVRNDPFIARGAPSLQPSQATRQIQASASRGRGGLQMQQTAGRGRGGGGAVGPFGVGSEFSQRLQGLMLVRDQMEHLATTHKDEEARLREMLLELLPPSLRSAADKENKKLKNKSKKKAPSSNSSSSSSSSSEHSATSDIAPKRASLTRSSNREASTRAPNSHKSKSNSGSDSSSSDGSSSSVPSTNQLVKERDNAIKLLENFQEQGNKVINTLHQKLKESNQENVRQLQTTERMKQENVRLRELLNKVSHAPTLGYGSPNRQEGSDQRKSNPLRLAPKTSNGDGSIDAKEESTSSLGEGAVMPSEADVGAGRARIIELEGIVAQRDAALEQHQHTLHEQEVMLERYDSLMKESDETLIVLRTENEEMGRELRELRARLVELYGSDEDDSSVASENGGTKEQKATWLHDPSSASSVADDVKASEPKSRRRGKSKAGAVSSPDQRRSMRIADILVKELRAEKSQRLSAEENAQSLMAQHQRHVVLLEQRLSKLMKQLYGGGVGGSTSYGSNRGASTATSNNSNVAVDEQPNSSSMNTARSSNDTLYTCSGGAIESPRDALQSSIQTPTNALVSGISFKSCASGGGGHDGQAQHQQPAMGASPQEDINVSPASTSMEPPGAPRNRSPMTQLDEGDANMSPMISYRTSQASTSTTSQVNSSLAGFEDIDQGALSPFQQRRQRRDESLQRHMMLTQLGQVSSPPTAFSPHPHGELDPSSPGPFVPHHSQRYQDPFRGYTPEDNADGDDMELGKGSALEYIAEQGEAEDVVDGTGVLSSTQNELPLGDTLGEASPPPQRLDHTAVASLPTLIAETTGKEAYPAVYDEEEYSLPNADSEKGADEDEMLEDVSSSRSRTSSRSGEDAEGPLEVEPVSNEADPGPVPDETHTPHVELPPDTKCEDEETSRHEAKPSSQHDDVADEEQAHKEEAPSRTPLEEHEEDDTRHHNASPNEGSSNSSSTSSSDEENEEELLREAELVAQSFA